MSNPDIVLMPILFLGVPLTAAWGYALRQTIRVSQRASQCGESSRWQRARASLMLGLLLLAGFLVLSIAPPWFQATVPPSLIRRTEIRLLAVAEVIYATAILIAGFALIPLLAVSISRRTAAKARLWTVRGLVMAFSILVAGWIGGRHGGGLPVGQLDPHAVATNPV